MYILLPLIMAAAVPAPATVPTAQMAAFNKPVPAGKVSAANPRSITAVLHDEGYRAKLITDDGPQPYIESWAEGAKFFISLENCTEHRDCQDLMFRSTYDKNKEKPVTVEQTNKFNREKRWGRAYLDAEGDVVIEYDVLFSNQLLDAATFKEAVGIWNSLLADFHKEIGFD